MKKYQDSNYAISDSECGGVGLKTKKEVDSNGKAYHDVNGAVVTEYGYVRVFTAYSEGVWKVSGLQFIKNGRMHTRKFKKNYSSQFLVTKAKEFAEELSIK